MGNRFSAVNGVRSPNFYEPGNAVNEIWIGDVEIISRLPFGASDMAQAGWPKGDYPKIPWRPFIIPLRAAVSKTANLFSDASPSISRRALASSPPNNILSVIKDAVNPWFVLLLLSVPFLVAPIVIYHWPRLYCRNCQHDRCSHLVCAALECEKGRTGRAHHPAFVHAIFAQALADVGVALMYFCLLALNNGAFLCLGATGKVSVPVQLCVEMISLVSRIYLLVIWFTYFGVSSWFRNADANDGQVVIDEPASDLCLEKRNMHESGDAGVDVKTP